MGVENFWDVCNDINKQAEEERDEQRRSRLLSMKEDMTLICRLERSIKRRMFRVKRDAIDEADVPAYVQQIVDNLKNTSNLIEVTDAGAETK